MSKFVNNSVKNQPVPRVIKNKLNCRKRLLSKQKRNPTADTATRIRNLSKEIKTYFYGATKNKVRRGIIPGNTKTLWDAVKIAKDTNINM